jgi:hypothetical protein
MLLLEGLALKTGQLGSTSSAPSSYSIEVLIHLLSFTHLAEMATMIRIIIVSLYTASVIGSRSARHHLLADHGHGRSSHGLLARQGCSASDVPCNGKCIPSDGVCCPDGNYCHPGWLCWPQDSGCCKPGYVVCGIGCMPPGSACCDSYGHYCDAGDQCILTSNGASKCCPDTETCDGQVAVTTFAAGTTITGTVPSTTIPSTATSSTATSSTAISSTTLLSSSVPTTSILSTPIASTSSPTTIESVVPLTSIVTTTLQSAPGSSAPSPSTVVVLTTVPFVSSTSEVPATSVVIIEQTTSASLTQIGSPTSAATSGSAFTGGAMVAPARICSELYAVIALAAGHMFL